MDRRAFLGGLAAFIASASLDPERLLWMPGQKTIFLPPAPSANPFITPEWLAREALSIMSRSLRFAGQINRDYSAAFDAGELVTVRIPTHALVPQRVAFQGA